AAATPIKSTATHRFEVCAAKTIGTTASAQINIASFRPALMVQPRLISDDESQPPPMLPMSASRYTTTSGQPKSFKPRPCRLCKKSGSQKRYTHQIGSVMNFAKEKAHVWRCGIRRAHGTLTTGSGGSLWMYSSSDLESEGCSSGRR